MLVTAALEQRQLGDTGRSVGLLGLGGNRLLTMTLESMPRDGVILKGETCGI